MSHNSRIITIKQMCYNIFRMAKKKQAKKQVETKEDKKFHEQLVAQMLSLATSGFGLVAALAWNQTIQDFVKQFVVPRIPGSGLISSFIYAVLITGLAVLITYQLSKLAAHFGTKK